MDGFIIKYEPKDDYGRTLLNHSLFGRIVYRNYRGRKYGYYIPGYLDKKPFFKVKVSQVFVKTIEDIDFDLLKNYANITIEKFQLPEQELLTGREFWTKKSQESGVMMRVRRRTKEREERERS